MKFDSFIGNRRVVERLCAKIRDDRFPHGLIFSGPEGVGKKTCALMIAKALNCTGSRAPADFCDECPNCRKVDANTHPDVVMVGVDDDSTQIKIAQIRQILATLQFRPLEGANKIFIIDPANMMNAEAANALLKGLEEPPENSYFILITLNVHELLLTVRSRCQTYHFTPLTLDEIRRHGVSDELLVRWSQGSIGRARNLDPIRLKREREVVLDFMELALTADEETFQDLLGASSELGRGKQDFDERMSIMAVLLNDLIYVKENSTDRMVNIDIRDRITKLAGRADVDRLLAMSEFLRFIESSVRSNVNRQMLTDVLALTANESMSKWIDPKL